MKRIFLTGFVALFIFAAQAQTKATTKKAKKTHVSSADAKAKAALAKQEEARQAKIEADRLDLLRTDSLRRDNDRVADSSFAAQQTNWKDSMSRTQDTAYANRYKGISAQQAQASQLNSKRDAINKAANLSSEQGRQVKNINEAYTGKAKAVTDNSSLADDQKKAQLASLNTERMTKIKAVLGKAKAKKLEKERKEYTLKNGADSEQAWIDTAEMATTNK